MTGVAKHASGHPPAPLSVAGTLKHPVAVAVSMQHLNSLVLSGPTFATSSGQQEKRPGPDVGQRGGESKPSDTLNNFDTQITRTQAPHVGQQKWRRQGNGRRR
jgi:hypothetical protein